VVAEDRDTTGTPDPSTGTPETDDGSEVEQDGGSASERPNDDAERLKNQIAQLLSEKTRFEQRERENEELRLRLQALEAQRQPSPGTNQDEALAREFQKAIAEGDPLAIIQLRQLQEQQVAQKRLEDRLELMSMPEAEREDVAREYQTGNYRSPAAARLALKGKKSGDLEKRLAELEAKMAAGNKRKAEDVIETTARSVGVTELRKRTLTHEEYSQQLDALPKEKARELKQRVDRGEVRVQG